MAHHVIVAPHPPHRHQRRGVGEVAGGAAAECAAVCCCCPCAVLNLVVLAVYKVPKGLVQKVARKKRRRLMKNKNNNNNNNNNVVVVGNIENDIVLLQPQRSSTAFDIAVGPTRLEEFIAKETGKGNKEDDEEGLEREMWARFAGTGFWRSESQRQP